MNQSFDVSTTPRCCVAYGTASALSGTTSRSRGCVDMARACSVDRSMAAAEAVIDDLDSLSVAGNSSVACSRCSYVTGCEVSDSVSNVFVAASQPVSSSCSSSGSSCCSEAVLRWGRGHVPPAPDSLVSPRFKS